MKTYNIFISHSWAYSDAYEKLIKLLEKKPYFSFKDHSVPKNDPIHNAPNSTKLYEAIVRQMRSCHIVIIMAGVYSTYSTWINKEIWIANNEFSYKKPILGVKPWANTRVSSTVQNNSDRLVGWNSSSIVGAIKEISL
jgi:hypothetical protein